MGQNKNRGRYWDKSKNDKIVGTYHPRQTMNPNVYDDRYVYAVFSKNGEYRKFDNHAGALSHARHTQGMLQKFPRNQSHRIEATARALSAGVYGGNE